MQLTPVIAGAQASTRRGSRALSGRRQGLAGECWCAGTYLLASVYDMPTTETGPASQVSRAQRFAEYVRPAVVAAGYDIDSPRGGGKKELAEAVGMSPSSVGRMLSGQTLPDPVHLERLAEVLGVPLMELLVRSGIVSPGAASASATSPAAQEAPLTAEAAARLLGIRSPDRVHMFTAMAKTLADQENADDERVRAGKGA
ncbi:helix-turn-helix domain-containing protein [Streptomyces sp. ECR3.8]|uniref:helix-turn-helix domain-containing protein n=1 Tax=Streptomyces sp. ECR3.8 TaxID=3461009 RepID=UPI004043618B